MKLAKLCGFALALVVATSASALRAEEAAAGPEGQPQLPPGWTAEDMQKMMAAGTPGKEHAHLVEGAGKWKAECKMWMAPDAEPLQSTGTSTVTPIMDGRYVKVEMEGEMPGMGPYRGLGIYGYDNQAKEFVSIWVDNHNTGIMQGKGKLSEDGKKLSWTYKAHCPIAEKMVSIRDIETITGPNTRKLESWAEHPKTGKEFKMMEIALTREGNEQARR
jgi:Protein of unknown function (DUF1579)